MFVIRRMLNMWKTKKSKRYIYGLIVTISIGMVFVIAFILNLFNGIQLKSSDFLLRIPNGNQTELSDRIIIIGINDQSLNDLGHISSWPRSHYAELIDILADSNARIIALDILFSEPGVGDDELERSISEANNVILPIVQATSTDMSSITGMTSQSGIFLKPLDRFIEGSIATGHANVIPDRDGIVRRIPLVLGNKGHYEPSLALAVVAKYLRRPGIIENPVSDSELEFVGRQIPLGNDNDMFVNYTLVGFNSNRKAFETVSFTDVINGKIEPVLFQDKIILVGATASGIQDTYWTPAGTILNGVEIHAAAIGTILADDFLKPAPPSLPSPQ